MDGTTEPIIAVIGHPIAGNPSQFAIERALVSLDLDWRVLSFDVYPEHIAAALEGFKVIGIAGVMIDPSVMSVASQWYATKSDSEAVAIDCLYRDDDLQFRGTDEQRAWLAETIARHGATRKQLIGNRDSMLPIDLDFFTDEEISAAPDQRAIAQAGLIVIAAVDGVPVTLELDDWSTNDGSTLVIDLTHDHPDLATIVERGYSAVACHQRRVGTLVQCMKRWTGCDASSEVISDAIEEYLGV